MSLTSTHQRRPFRWAAGVGMTRAWGVLLAAVPARHNNFCMTRATRLALTLMLVVAGADCTPPTVVRVYDGVPQQGRFIPPWSYAAYASAAEAEVRGDRAGAIAHYRRALASDENSPDAYAHLVGLYCAVGDNAAAQRAYQQALALAPQYPEALYRWALCQTQRSDPRALPAARAAARVAPEDERVVVLLVQLLLDAERDDEALVWLRGLLRRQPGYAPGWRMLEKGNAASWRIWRRRARRHMRTACAGATPSRPCGGIDPLAAVDAALLDDDVTRARDILRRKGLAPVQLAVRALALGQWQRARVYAQRRMLADPHDFTARVVLAWILDQRGEAAAAAALLYRAPTPHRLDTTSRQLMARLLARHVGHQSAQLWAGAAMLGAPVRNEGARARGATDAATAQRP